VEPDRGSAHRGLRGDDATRPQHGPARVPPSLGARRLRPLEGVAHDTVGVLRRAAAQHPDDQELEALVGELSVKSTEFARWWASADVHEKTHGVKRYAHPVVGELELRFETFALPGDPGQALLTYVAEPGSTSETALKLLEQLAAETDSGTRAAVAD
jgi:hypothetical protein